MPKKGQGTAYPSADRPVAARPSPGAVRPIDGIVPIRVFRATGADGRLGGPPPGRDGSGCRCPTTDL
jgi:hypothetical protein